MNTARMAILGVASLAGVCCIGVLLHGMAGAKPPPRAVVVAPPPAPTLRVLVARHDLNVGDRIQPGDMNWQAWPADGLNPAFITDGGPRAVPPQGQLGRAVGAVADVAKSAISNPADGAGANFVGAVVRERIIMNEPLMASKVVRAGASGVLAVTLDAGMRAVALPLTAESAAGGFVLPGDHVDVLLTRQTDSAGTAAPGRGFITGTVMRNVRVLAVDQNMSAQKTASAVGATATVQATPAQAEDLVLAKASGTLTLALRSYADAAGPAEVGSLNRERPGSGMAVRVFHDGMPTPVAVNQ